MKTFVLSLGGSIVVPEEIDVVFLKKFIKLISNLSLKNKFYIVVGGGKTCRKYQAAERSLGVNDPQALDWTGIAATRLNARLLQALFKAKAADDIVKNPNQLPKTNKRIIFAGGWKPGWSTDYVAVCIAKKIKAEAVINLSNIDYIYSADPKKDPQAEKIEKLTWLDLRGIVGNRWVPGMNLPFDPVACQLAEKNKIKLIVANGLNIANLAKIIEGKKFSGSLVV